MYVAFVYVCVCARNCAYVRAFACALFVWSVCVGLSMCPCVLVHVCVCVFVFVLLSVIVCVLYACVSECDCVCM